MSRRSVTFGRLVLTTCHNPGGPRLDPCRMWNDDEAWSAGGWALRLPRSGRALVVGWKGARPPWPKREATR